MSANDHYAYIHSALPKPLPKGAIVADVEFEPLPRGDYRRNLLMHGFPARVRRMVQGDYGGEWILVRPVTWSSCDSMFENGRAGLLVAVPRRTEGRTLVVDPIKVWSADGYRLPDGFEVSPETLKRAALPSLRQVQPRPSSAPTTWWLAAFLPLLAAIMAAWCLVKRPSE